MQEQLIQFETAKLAKELGFNFLCEDGFHFLDVRSEVHISDFKEDINFNEAPNYYSRPTQSLLQKWLRDKYTIDITVITNFKKGKRIYYVGLSYINENNEIDIWFSVKDTIKIEYNTYEEALEVGLIEGLKLIKNEKGNI